MRVLVVDDSRAMRAILRTTLRGLGWEVTEANDGRDGLERMRAEGPFSLALVDWNMPELNGYEFVCAVRSDPHHSGMKMIMVTTEVETAQVVRALSAGADEYIMKPFTREILREKIEMLAIV